MVKLENSDISKIATLFESVAETMVWSCLQGCMGEVWADDSLNPTAAQLIIADFAFFAGDSSSLHAQELVRNMGEDTHDCLIMVPLDEAWGELIERVHGNEQRKLTRYAIKKEGNIFDRSLLIQFASGLPSGYTAHRIDREIFTLCSMQKWSSDLCRWYRDYEDFSDHGIGYVILRGGELVAGASSYTWYRQGIEIEIDTKKEYRRQGLATVCASMLILECMDKGLYPSWDAANLGSVALAEKLGYHLHKEYTAYLVNY